MEADHDIDRLRKVFRRAVQQMNASGIRFQHPIKILSGLWGNTLYKYQHGGFSDAPWGALFTRLYNEGGRYNNIEECYGQAEIVIAAIKRNLINLDGKWEIGMASQPGHYWAAAKLESGSEKLYVNMDAWKDDFYVSSGNISWSKR